MINGPRKSRSLAKEALRLHSTGLTWWTVCYKLKVKPDRLQYWIKKLEKEAEVS